MTNLTESLETGVSLIGMRKCLALVQTAYTMATEGITRATASEISSRESIDYGHSLTPANVGQAFAALGIKTVTSHGKTRFVLEVKELEKIREVNVAYCEELSQKLEAYLESYQELNERVETLVARLKEFYQLKQTEKRLEHLLGEEE